MQRDLPSSNAFIRNVGEYFNSGADLTLMREQLELFKRYDERQLKHDDLREVTETGTLPSNRAIGSQLRNTIAYIFTRSIDDTIGEATELALASVEGSCSWLEEGRGEV